MKRPNLVEIKRFVYENQDICVNQSMKTEVKGIYESVISSDSRCENGKAGFTTVPLKHLSVQKNERNFRRCLRLKSLKL